MKQLGAWQGRSIARFVQMAMPLVGRLPAPWLKAQPSNANGQGVSLQQPSSATRRRNPTGGSATKFCERSHAPRGTPNRPCLCAFAGMIALAGCGEEPAARNQAAAAPPSVPVSRPVGRQVSDWDEFTGRFVATSEVQIRARASGYLAEIHFKDGQEVEEGDVLFTIDPRPYEAAVQAAQASVAEIQAGLNLSRTDLERAAQLLRTQAVAQSVYDQRESGVQRGVAQLLLAQANLRRAQLDLEFATVRAPFAGRIDRHNLSVGNLVAADTTLLTTLITLDPIHFVFDVDQSAYLRYTRAANNGERPGSRDAPNPVRLQLADETGFPHAGRVDFLSNQVDQATGTIRARALLENDRQLFTPGVFGRVQLLSSAPYEAVLLPDEAIGTDQSRRFAYVLNGENMPEQKQVELGRLIDGLRVIRSGVGAEDVVVVGGLQRIRPGQRVTPREQPINAPERAPTQLGSASAPGGTPPAAQTVSATNPVPAGQAGRTTP